MRLKKPLLVLAFSLASIIPMSSPVTAACTISTTPLRFGAYNVFSHTPRDSTATVTYTCDRSSPITITLDRGGAASFNARQMLHGSGALNYNLYLDASGATIWGDGTGGTRVYSDPSPPINRPVTVTIYGRIPARQNVRTGAYTSRVAIIINF